MLGALGRPLVSRTLLIALFVVTASHAPSLAHAAGPNKNSPIPPPSHTYWVQKALLDHIEHFSNLMGDHYCEEIVAGAEQQKQRIQELYTTLLPFLENQEKAQLAARLFRDYGAFIKHQTLRKCQISRDNECSTKEILYTMNQVAVRTFEEWQLENSIQSTGGPLRRYAALLTTVLFGIEFFAFLNGHTDFSLLLPVTFGITIGAWYFDPTFVRNRMKNNRMKVHQAAITPETSADYLLLPQNSIALKDPGIAPWMKRREPSPHIWIRPLISYVFAKEYSTVPEEAKEQRIGYHQSFDTFFKKVKNKRLASTYIRAAYYALSYKESEWPKIYDSFLRILIAKDSEHPEKILRQEIEALKVKPD